MACCLKEVGTNLIEVYQIEHEGYLIEERRNWTSEPCFLIQTLRSSSTYVPRTSPPSLPLLVSVEGFSGVELHRNRWKRGWDGEMYYIIYWERVPIFFLKKNSCIVNRKRRNLCRYPWYSCIRWPSQLWKFYKKYRDSAP